jgi:hypothetical protein
MAIFFKGLVGYYLKTLWRKVEFDTFACGGGLLPKVGFEIGKVECHFGCKGKIGAFIAFVDGYQRPFIKIFAQIYDYIFGR